MKTKLSIRGARKQSLQLILVTSVIRGVPVSGRRALIQKCKEEKVSVRGIMWSTDRARADLPNHEQQLPKTDVCLVLNYIACMPGKDTVL